MLDRRREDRKLTAKESTMYIQVALHDRLAYNFEVSGPRRTCLGHLASAYRELIIKQPVPKQNNLPNLCLDQELELLHRVGQRAFHMTAGMLELENPWPAIDSTILSECQEEWKRGVVFLHRTARDFFLHQSEGVALLQSHPLTSWDIFKLDIRGFLRACQMRLEPEPDVDEIIALLQELKRQWDSQRSFQESSQMLELLSHIEAQMALIFSDPMVDSRMIWLTRVTKSDDISFGAPVDFCGLTMLCGIVELTEKRLRGHFCSDRERNDFHQRYTDYLLLCAAGGIDERAHEMPRTIRFLLEKGANLSSRFYLASDFPARVTPFFEFLLNRRPLETSLRSRKQARTQNMLNKLLLAGADLGNVNVALYTYRWTDLGHLEWNCIRRARHETVAKYLPDLLVIKEVNAQYLCDEAGLQTKRYTVAPFHQILLVGLVCTLLDEDIGALESYDYHAPYLSYAEIQPNDAELVGTLLEKLPQTTRDRTPYGADLLAVQDALREICSRSPTVDLKDYLERKGYYKKHDDPDVLKEAPPMFEEGDPMQLEEVQAPAPLKHAWSGTQPVGASLGPKRLNRLQR